MRNIRERTKYLLSSIPAADDKIKVHGRGVEGKKLMRMTTKLAIKAIEVGCNKGEYATVKHALKI